MRENPTYRERVLLACDVIRRGKVEAYLDSCPPEVAARARSIKLTFEEARRMFKLAVRLHDERMRNARTPE
ncbi:hypothetical protein LMG32289_00284 [Cupriavidus pampae]|uniref:Uncharacterized protein n=1 Tax=Cupriavidus pampae TaxID=659251 RepID=A0ABN7XU83_9BURK|nr:hypothetical protein LMG32289_00284 [Cupriavidus pampae]